MSHEDPSQAQPSEEELRARLEEELRRITVRDVLLQTVVSLVNLGGQRLGLAEGAQDMRDLGQVRLAIEGVRALLPLLEEENPEQVQPVREALSQLQMVYAREMGAGGPPPSEGTPEGGGEPPSPEPEAPPRDRGRSGLWVPPGSTT
jgi:MoxR-like ATPase